MKLILLVILLASYWFSKVSAISTACLNRTCLPITNDMLSEVDGGVGLYDINVYLCNNCDQSELSYIVDITMDSSNNGKYKLANNSKVWLGINYTEIPGFNEDRANPWEYPFDCVSYNDQQCRIIIPLDNIGAGYCGQALYYSLYVTYIQGSNRSKRSAWGLGTMIGEELNDGTYSRSKILCDDQCKCNKPPVPVPPKTTLPPTQQHNSLVIIETLLNGFSQYQVDVTGKNPIVRHPTGFTIYTMFNPFSSMVSESFPQAFPPYSNVVGQNTGFCLTLTDDKFGQRWCSSMFVFYNSSLGVCVPPTLECQNSDYVTGTISYQGVYPSLSGSTSDFYTLAIVGGTGIYSGISGRIIAQQIDNYAYYMYKIFFD